MVGRGFIGICACVTWRLELLASGEIIRLWRPLLNDFKWVHWPRQVAKNSEDSPHRHLIDQGAQLIEEPQKSSIFRFNWRASDLKKSTRWYSISPLIPLCLAIPIKAEADRNYISVACCKESLPATFFSTVGLRSHNEIWKVITSDQSAFQ